MLSMPRVFIESHRYSHYQLSSCQSNVPYHRWSEGDSEHEQNSDSVLVFRTVWQHLRL